MNIPDTNRANGQNGQSSVPYYDVYRDYAKSADRAMENEQIPATERQRVKSYFDALNPAHE
jgi:hypothetical protein